MSGFIEQVARANVLRDALYQSLSVGDAYTETDLRTTPDAHLNGVFDLGVAADIYRKAVLAEVAGWLRKRQGADSTFTSGEAWQLASAADRIEKGDLT